MNLKASSFKCGTFVKTSLVIRFIHIFLITFLFSCGDPRESVANKSNLNAVDFEIAVQKGQAIFDNLNNQNLLDGLTDQEKATIRQQIVDEVASAIQATR